MLRHVFWTLFLLLTFAVTLPASWWVLAKMDFGYGFLYDQIGISAHIQKYSPRNNQNKKDFELTTKAERVALFHGTVGAIQQQGKGLEQLAYMNKTQQHVSLYTVAEIIHLKDVANLLEKLKVIALIITMAWFLLVIILWLRRIAFPPIKQFVLSSSFLIIFSILLLLLGPEKIFNQLHIWVFPNNHQWFFYYEESLMSTMMKAPDLFGYIAGLWALLSVVFTAFLLKIHPRF